MTTDEYRASLGLPSLTSPYKGNAYGPGGIAIPAMYQPGANLSPYVTQNQNALNGLMGGNQQIAQNAVDKVSSSPLNPAMTSTALGLLDTPTITDAMKTQGITRQSDVAATGYTAGRKALLNSLARSGMADSGAGAGMERRLGENLTGKLGTIAADADTNQALANRTGSLQALSAAGGVQGLQGSQTLQGLNALINAIQSDKANTNNSLGAIGNIIGQQSRLPKTPTTQFGLVYGPNSN